MVKSFSLISTNKELGDSASIKELNINNAPSLIPADVRARKKENEKDSNKENNFKKISEISIDEVDIMDLQSKKQKIERQRTYLQGNKEIIDFFDDNPINLQDYS